MSNIFPCKCVHCRYLLYDIQVVSDVSNWENISFGKYSSIRGGGYLKRNIMKYEKDLKEAKETVLQTEDGMPIVSSTQIFPRYVRINKLKAVPKEVVGELLQDLKRLSPTVKAGSGSQKYSEQRIYVDAHVNFLLVLPPKLSIPWHELELVKSGKIVLQDKSSCFSALALVHGSHGMIDGDYIDACAAPGNKTSHLAAIVYDELLKGGQKKSAKVFCFDRSTARLSILKERMSQLAPLISDGNKASKNKCKFPVEICPMLQDFLKADPNDFQQVRSILLDPSCSGSGIVNQPDRSADVEKGDNGDRIEALSNFQLVALKHAMSFPNVNRIVYSTCSVHERENEDVVATALIESNKGIEDTDLKWQLVSPKALRHWKRRGLDHKCLTKEQSKCLIRVNGMEDDTNGFFVSYFERRLVTQLECRNSASPPITIVEGTSGIYNGHFEIADTDHREIWKNGRSEKEAKFVSKGTKEATVVPRKKQKKLDWKKKQKERKLERIRQKK